MRFLLTTYTIANYKDPSRFDRNLAKEICIHLRAEGIPVETEEISSDTIFVDPCSIKADHQGDHFEVQHADFIKIENQENGKFYLIDFQDGPQVTQALNEHPKWIGSSLTMFSPWWNRQFIKNDHRCIPGFYFPMHPC